MGDTMTKRFTWDNLGEVDAIADGDTFRWYLMLDGITDLVKFMNEQDERIKELEDFIKVHVEGTVADEVL